MAPMTLPFPSCSESVCSRLRTNRRSSFALRAVDTTISMHSVRLKRRGASLLSRRLVVRCASGFIAALLVMLLPQHAWAATGLDGAAMGWPFALPFAGLLLSVALGPLLFAGFWHHHYGKIAAAWALVTLAALTWQAGPATALASYVHALLGEYLSFIVLLFALYTVAGGILVTGTIRGTPATNTAILALGTIIASFVGTTGAAM